MEGEGGDGGATRSREEASPAAVASANPTLSLKSLSNVPQFMFRFRKLASGLPQPDIGSDSRIPFLAILRSTNLDIGTR